MVLKTTIFAADQWPFFALDKTHTFHKFESRAVRFWSICKFWSRSTYWIFIKPKTETIDFKSCHWYSLFFNEFENHHFRCRPMTHFDGRTRVLGRRGFGAERAFWERRIWLLKTQGFWGRTRVLGAPHMTTKNAGVLRPNARFGGAAYDY